MGESGLRRAIVFLLVRSEGSRSSSETLPINQEGRPAEDPSRDRPASFDLVRAGPWAVYRPKLDR